MKFYKHSVLLAALVLGIPASSRANEYTADLRVIVEAFSSKDPELQYEAYSKLVGFVARGTAPGQENGGEKVTLALLDCLNNEGVSREAKKYILRELARVGTGTAVAPLGKIMAGKDYLLAESARQALEQIQDAKATEVLIKAVAGAPDKTARQTYLRTLAGRMDSTTLSYFTKGLDSDDPLMVLESVHALERIGGKEATLALQSAYGKNPGAELKRNLQRALVSLPDTSEDMLLEIHNSGIQSASRQAALMRLVEGNFPKSVNLLRFDLSGSDPHLRAAAIHVALASGNQDLIQSNASNLSNDDWRVVLGGLNAFDDKMAETLALKAVENEDTGIQVQALRALATYGTGRSVDLVMKHFSGRDKELKQAAAYAIERMPGTALNGKLNKMLNSDAEDDVILAIEALEYRDIPNAKNRLHRFITGDNTKLAREALRTLSVIADEEDLYRLFFLVRRTDNEELGKLISGMLKKVASEIGSLELQAKVKNL